MVRLRQVCLAAPRLAPAIADLRDALGVREGFHDPGVGVFGLENEVAVLGDTFVEIVAPTRPDTAAGRWLERRGGAPGGYMLLFEVDDLAALRARIAAAGARIVFEAVAPGIVGVHLHPRDLGGCIVSADVPEVAGEWPWAGPGWRERGIAGGLAGATVGVVDPDAALARWRAVLGCPARGRMLVMADGATVAFVPATGHEAVTAVAVRGPARPTTVRQGVEWTWRPA